jgi:hypothetical protein
MPAKRRRRSGLSGVLRTCVLYKKKRDKNGNLVMRCRQFTRRNACPGYKGQRKKFSECTTHSTRKAISHRPC